PPTLMDGRRTWGRWFGRIRHRRARGRPWLRGFRRRLRLPWLLRWRLVRWRLVRRVPCFRELGRRRLRRRWGGSLGAGAWAGLARRWWRFGFRQLRWRFIGIGGRQEQAHRRGLRGPEATPGWCIEPGLGRR